MELNLVEEQQEDLVVMVLHLLLAQQQEEELGELEPEPQGEELLGLLVFRHWDLEPKPLEHHGQLRQQFHCTLKIVHWQAE